MYFAVKVKGEGGSFGTNRDIHIFLVKANTHYEAIDKLMRKWLDEKTTILEIEILWWIDDNDFKEEDITHIVSIDSYKCKVHGSFCNE